MKRFEFGWKIPVVVKFSQCSSTAARTPEQSIMNPLVARIVVGMGLVNEDVAEISARLSPVKKRDGSAVRADRLDSVSICCRFHALPMLANGAGDKPGRSSLMLGDSSPAVERFDFTAHTRKTTKDLCYGCFTMGQIHGCKPHLVVEVIRPG